MDKPDFCGRSATSGILVGAKAAAKVFADIGAAAIADVVAACANLALSKASTLRTNYRPTNAAAGTISVSLSFSKSASVTPMALLGPFNLVLSVRNCAAALIISSGGFTDSTAEIKSVHEVAIARTTTNSPKDLYI